MKVEWLYEARNEYRDILIFYRTQIGKKYAQALSKRVLAAVKQLEHFPESGVIKHDTRMGEYGFRALFIDQYVCVYKIIGETAYIYHFADARRNYIYNIFGMEE